MASPLLSVLIAGHSFVKRLHSDLQRKFDLRAAVDFNLTQTATVSLHGISGLTVRRLARKLRLLFAHHPPPRVIILEIGTNDLSSQSPEVVIGELLDLVDFLQSVDSSTAVGVCKVLPRRHRSTGLPQEDFNNRAATFNKMLEALFDDRQFVFVWRHLEMQSLSRRVLLPDGVHLNRHGQYCLYRSYRGAILKGVSLLSNSLVHEMFVCRELRSHVYDFPQSMLSFHDLNHFYLLTFYVGCCTGQCTNDEFTFVERVTTKLAPFMSSIHL